MQQIDMSNEKPMGIAGNAPRMRYSAAYPTGAERIVFSCVDYVEAGKVGAAVSMATVLASSNHYSPGTGHNFGITWGQTI